MMHLRETFTPEEMSDKKIMERVLGRKSVYLRGWGRSPNTNDIPGACASTKTNQPSYQELLQKFNDATTRLDEVFSILRQKNLMPATSGTNEMLGTNEASDADLDSLE